MDRGSLVEPTATLGQCALAGCALPGVAQDGVKTPFKVAATRWCRALAAAALLAALLLGPARWLTGLAG